MAMIDKNDQHRLFSPSERPEACIVIYDGQCRFCRRQVERLARWDRGQLLSFLSLHDPEVPRRFPDLTHDELMQHLYLIDREGKRHVGAEAFVFLSRHLPILWPLAPILNVPGTTPLWQWCYRQIAKRRYAMGRADCDGGSCDVHFK